MFPATSYAHASSNEHLNPAFFQKPTVDAFSRWRYRTWTDGAHPELDFLCQPHGLVRKYHQLLALVLMSHIGGGKSTSTPTSAVILPPSTTTRPTPEKITPNPGSTSNPISTDPAKTTEKTITSSKAVATTELPVTEATAVGSCVLDYGTVWVLAQNATET
ncbi:hypothetical protein C8Q76DRAFT_797556 [Earliella scabrosa]|nr:hypothetical protein C8Q76DRAFT_797556 [Earliella scabrosa]